MSWLSDLFSSPRERAAPGLEQGQMNSFDEIMSSINNMQDTEGGVSDIAGVKSKFGLTGVDQPFNIAKKNLGTARAKSLRSVSDRMSSSMANPEAAFSPVESDFASSEGALESEQANADIGEQHYEAGLLDQILNEQNQFGFKKNSMKTGVLGQKGSAIQNYLGSLSGASTFDDIMAGLGQAAKVPTGKDSSLLTSAIGLI